MTQARKHLISLEDTPYYHIVSRCVRRTYLCGIDRHSGKNYEHRRQWIEDRIRLLSSIFAIDICAYAVMSNHIHLAIHLNKDEHASLSDHEVVDRWLCLFRGPLLIQKFQKGESLEKAELDTVNDVIEMYRKRLLDISWFMKCLNEPIARQANKEDGCTGHFWEGRFKSQALLTEEALLSCMAYIDLNPIRAKMANTPETSDYTSIKERIKPAFNLSKAIQLQQNLDCLNSFELPMKPLVQFEGSLTNQKQNGILFSINDYLTLVDMTGRILRDDKRSAIATSLPPILQRLNVEPEDWLANTTAFEARYSAKFSKRRNLKRAS